MNTIFRTLQLTLLVLLTGMGINAQAAVGDQLGCISGDCENGTGTLVEDGEQGLVRYRGPFVNGKYHGFGKLELLDKKLTYKGNFQNGVRHGRGTQWDGENNVYIGLWRNDKRNGMGLQAYKVTDWREDKYT